MKIRFPTLIGLTILLFACVPVATDIEPLLGNRKPSAPPQIVSTPVVTVTPTPSPTATQTPIPTNPPTPTETAQPLCLRIMPLGDSITVGVPYHTDYGGYRNLLGTLLTNDGYVVDFVGSQQDGIGVIPDPDHEGHSGWKLFNLTDAIDSEGWLEAYQPDIILLHMGTNDIDRGYAASAPENLSTLLDDILLRLPEAHVIVAQIIPYSFGLLDEYIAYNAAIPDIVASRGPRVTMVDMQNILSPDDYADPYHPNSDKPKPKRESRTRYGSAGLRETG